ncbi:MAG: hypothetical protein WCD86_12660 [Ktedonobacteraceae bacterium]
MSIFVGQLPPAEVARLKAELAETLIAHFCYPRFFDYRTGTLRSRPVDRAKRQEVWLYLSSFDFTAWNRVDIMSPEFQRQIERLFILFVQRNRNFFGEQGRKRMSDIRLLIGSSSTTVVQGLRNHLSGQRQNNPPFGSPRPASSWITPNTNGNVDAGWEQIAQSTTALQQQLQELRGEIRIVPPTPHSDTLTATPRRPGRRTAPSPAKSSAPDREVALAAPVEASIPAASNGRGPTPLSDQRNAPTAAPATAWSSAPTAPVPAIEVASVAFASAIPPATPVKPVESPLPRVTAPEKAATALTHTTAAAVTSPSVTSQRASSAQQVNEEDVAIFEELRRQLIIWLRIQVIQAGIELTNQGPTQLLELLRQHDNYDETRLQIVSTLLNFANQVVKNGHATAFDYKQALMFHLMHCQR